MFINGIKSIAIKPLSKGLIFILLFTIFDTTLIGKEDSVFVKIIGDTVQIWNINVTANCASKFNAELTIIEKSNIVIIQCDTVGPIANCMCSYDLYISLMGLNSGQYTVSIYREEKKKYFYSKDTTKHVGELIFTLQNSSPLPFDWTFYQGECLPLTEGELTSFVPQEFLLEQNYPNPFNNITLITYQLPRTEVINLTIYNIRGEVVKKLIRNEINLPGRYIITWDGRDENGKEVSSGVYFYMLHSINYRNGRKMILLK